MATQEAVFHDDRSTDALRESEAQLRAILNATLDGIITFDEYDRILTFNPAAEKIFGYTAQSVIGAEFKKLFPEFMQGDHEAYMGHYRTDNRNVSGITREVIGRRADQTSFPMELAINEIQTGKRHVYAAVVRDLSEQKKAKNRYLQKTSELQAIFEALPDFFFRLDSDGSVIDYHTGHMHRLNANTDRLLENRIQDIFPPDVGRRYDTAIASLRRTKSVASFEYAIGEPGDQVIYEARLLPFLRKEVIVVVRDVTERKKAEASLQLSEMRYNALAEVLPVGIFRADRSGSYIYVNERWCSIAQPRQRDDALGGNWINSIHRDDRPRIWEAWQEAVTGGRPFKAEYRFQHVDNVVAWVYCQAVPEIDADNRITGYVGTVIDITDRIYADEALRKAKIDLELAVEERTADLRATNRWLRQMVTERERAEKALREERNFIFAVLETAGALVVVCEPDGHIVRCNRSFQDTTGYSEEELKNQTIWDRFVAPEDLENSKQAFQELIAGMNRNEHESHWLTRSGQPRLISWSNTTIRDGDNSAKYVICTGIDITERRAAEEEARQHQADLVHVSRLCTMGEMAAGLAHELNQPLAAIVSYTQGCVRRLANGEKKPGELLHAMKQVTAQAQRAGEIIKHLRNFVSKGEPHRAPVQVNTMVRETLSMAKMDVRKHGVTVRLRLSEQLPDVHVDMIQIEQVLLNLVRNGMEAMANPPPDAKELVIRTFINQNGQVEVSVADNGEGLPPGGPDKVFDAFFTTKKEGMGMGLAISRSIMEAHGGRLWAEDNPERGTTFHFTLPVSGGEDHGETTRSVRGG